MTNSIQRDLEELETDIEDMIDKQSRPVSILQFINKEEFGETTNILNSETVISGMRQIPALAAQEYIKTKYGIEEKTDYQIMFLAKTLVDNNISDISPDAIFKFEDIPNRTFKPVTPLLNAFPFGESEILKTIFLKENVYEQKYSEVR